ncbi:hypothetical protein OF83DRAFT_1084461 [Amylostereum chailletii]|nr:hypothetical protein OF83DRAFT_1084461 [Amylostereum chailletii]
MVVEREEYSHLEGEIQDRSTLTVVFGDRGIVALAADAAPRRRRGLRNGHVISHEPVPPGASVTPTPSLSLPHLRPPIAMKLLPRALHHEEYDNEDLKLNIENLEAQLYDAKARHRVALEARDDAIDKAADEKERLKETIAKLKADVQTAVNQRKEANRLRQETLEDKEAAVHLKACEGIVRAEEQARLANVCAQEAQARITALETQLATVATNGANNTRADPPASVSPSIPSTDCAKPKKEEEEEDPALLAELERLFRVLEERKANALRMKERSPSPDAPPASTAGKRRRIPDDDQDDDDDGSASQKRRVEGQRYESWSGEGRGGSVVA